MNEIPKCEQCGKPLTDVLALFTKYQVCGACVKKNHGQVNYYEIAEHIAEDNSEIIKATHE